MNSSLLALLLLLLAAGALAANTPPTSPPDFPIHRVPFNRRFDKGVVAERVTLFKTYEELSKAEAYRYFDYRDKAYDNLESGLEALLAAEPGVISGLVLEFVKEHKRKEGNFAIDDEDVYNLQARLKGQTKSLPEVVEAAVEDSLIQAANAYYLEFRADREQGLEYYVDEEDMDNLLKKILPDATEELIRRAREFVNDEKLRVRRKFALGRDAREIEAVLDAIGDIDIEPAAETIPVPIRNLDRQASITRRPTRLNLHGAMPMDDAKIEEAGSSSMSSIPEGENKKSFVIIQIESDDEIIALDTTSIETAGSSSMTMSPSTPIKSEDESEKMFFIEEKTISSIILSLVHEAKVQIFARKAALNYKELESYNKDKWMVDVLNSLLEEKGYALLEKIGYKGKVNLNFDKMVTATKKQDEIERYQKHDLLQKFNDDGRMIIGLKREGAGEGNDIEEAVDFARTMLTLRYAVKKEKNPYVMDHLLMKLDKYCRPIITQDLRNAHDIEIATICINEIPILLGNASNLWNSRFSDTSRSG